MELQPLPVRRAAASYRMQFFRNWLDDPFNVASVMPSGRMLARRMAQGLHAGNTIIELGAGSGTLTREILAAGVRSQDLYLVERNENFAALLKREFPQAQTRCAEAQALEALFPALIGKVDCIVSGLPILWFEREIKVEILTAVFNLLGPEGCLHQFTYLGRPPVSRSIRDELGLRATLIGLAPLNLPPAFVYRFSRKRQ